jgi:hypothetical protein
MNSHLIRPLILGVFAFPLLVAAQQGNEDRQHPAVIGGQGVSTLAGAGNTGEVAPYSDPGNTFFSNVPINELSPKAYRRFHRLFREAPTGEYWFKYAQGYKVSFTSDQQHEFAYFDTNGAFLYSLKYYEGRELSKDLTDFVKRRFPDYKVDVVTEVNNGQGTFYMLQIMNPDHIKLLTIADGRIDVIKDLANGSANVGPAEAAR